MYRVDYVLEEPWGNNSLPQKRVSRGTAVRHRDLPLPHELAGRVEAAVDPLHGRGSHADAVGLNRGWGDGVHGRGYGHGSRLCAHLPRSQDKDFSHLAELLLQGPVWDQGGVRETLQLLGRGHCHPQAVFGLR